MKQVKSKILLYFLLSLAFLRPCLDILSQFQFQLHNNLPYLNINIIIGSLVFIIGFIWLAKNIKSAFKTPLFKIIIFFLGLTFISIFYTFDKAVGFQEFIRLATIFLLYFLSFKLIDSKEDFYLLIKVILASYILPALFALAQLFLGLGLPDDFNGFLRIFGTFAHPNPFAFYTFYILSLLLILILTKDLVNPEFKQYLWLAALAVIILLLFSYCRSALFALFLFLFFLGIFKYRKLLLIGVIVFIAAYLFLPAFQQRFYELISLDPYGSVVWRFRLWKDMLPVALWHPLFGQGLDSFQSIVEFYRGYDFGSLEAHNDYLKILVENGIAGLLSYALIILGLLIYLWKIFIKAQARDKSLALGILIIVLSLYSVSFFDNILRATALQWNLWILLGGWLRINRK